MKPFSILLKRINGAKNIEDLKECEAQITRHYDAGTITAKELMRLDVKIMERMVDFEILFSF